MSLAFTNKGQCSFWLQCSLEYGCNCKTYRLDHRKCPKAIDTLALSITLLLTGSMIEYRYWIGILIFCQTSTYICILTCGWTRTCHRVTFIVIIHKVIRSFCIHAYIICFRWTWWTVRRQLTWPITPQMENGP